jgi:hypothetical protein
LAADRQLRPFVGATFAGAITPTFVDVESTLGGPNIAIGGNTAILGELFGVEVDLSDIPGVFEGHRNLVRSSRVTTFSGNLVIAAPRRLTEYALRPYVVAGVGLMRVRTTTAQNVFDVASTLPAFDVGAGAIGFITNRIGVCWDVRRFQDIRNDTTLSGLTLDVEHLSFWRGTMAIVIRY